MKHVYITGCPRSGTTMLASMLANKTALLATPESDFFIDFIYKYLPKKSDLVSSSKYIDFLSENYRFKQWNIDSSKIKDLPETISISNYNLVIESTVNSFAKKQTSTNNNFTRIDHTPSSIKNFDIIMELFADAKFIFIVRDPRAIYASVKGLDWGANTALLLSETWNEYLTCYFSLKSLFPNQVYLTRYEDIIVDATAELKKICGFVDISFHESMLEGKGFNIPGYTAIQHNLVGKKLDKNRIEKWKQELTLKETLIIESKCRSTMMAFEYKISKDVNFKIGAKEKLSTLFKESYYYFVNKIKKNKREKLPN